MGQLRDDITQKTKSNLDSKEEKLFNLSKKAWDASQDYFETLKPTIMRRHNMYNSIHDSEEKYCEDEYKRNSHYIPKSHEFVKNSVAQVVQAYFMNPDLVYLTPEVSEDVVAGMSSEYFTYVLKKRLKSKNCSWLTFIQMTSSSGFTHNMCMAKVDWDLKERETTVIPIAIENLRVDPHADPLDPIHTSSYIIHRLEMYVDKLKAKQELDGWLEFDDEDLHSNFVGSADTNEDIQASRNIDGIENRQNRRAIDIELEKVYVHENIIRYRDEYHIFYTLGTTKMLTKIFKLEEIYPQGIPFVMAPIYPEEMKIYSSAPLDHAYHAQKTLNHFINIIFDSAELINWPIKIVQPGSVDIKKLKYVGPNAIVEARNPEKAIHQLTNQINPQSLRNELPTIMASFDSTTGGLPNSTLSVDSEQTATGQNMKNRLGSQVINMYLINYNERFIEPVLELMLKCERVHGLADEKFVQKVFKNLALLKRYAQRLQEEGIDVNNFNIDEEFKDAELNLSVNVGMGAVTPQMRVEQFLASINAIVGLTPNIVSQLNTEEIIKELMSLNGYKDHGRFFSSTQHPMITQLQQELQQTQAELKQKRTPEEVAADIQLKQASAQDKLKAMELKDAQIKKVAADTVLVNVGSQVAALDAAEKLIIQPETAIGGDKVMENAGFQDPTPEDGVF